MAGEVSKQFTTLKIMPTLGLPDYSINQSKSAFTLFLADVFEQRGTRAAAPIVDPDGGVQSCTYEIYTLSQLNADTGELEGSPVKTVHTENAAASMEISVDDATIMRNIEYCYKVVVHFDDNEKVVEIESAVSAPFSLTAAKYPSVEFLPDENKTDDTGALVSGIGHDRFTGTINIIDDSGVVLTKNNVVTMNIVGNDGGTAQIRTWDIEAKGGSLSTPINVTGLRANTTYTVTLRGKVNLQDPNNPYDMEIYLGSFR